jgi:hypothetical protein
MVREAGVLIVGARMERTRGSRIAPQLCLVFAIVLDKGRGSQAIWSGACARSVLAS